MILRFFRRCYRAKCQLVVEVMYNILCINHAIRAIFKAFRKPQTQFFFERFIPADSRMDVAIFEWIKTYESSTESLSSLSNGLVFSRLLAQVDPSWFRLYTSSQAETGRAGWVFRFNFLKRLHKLMISFLDNQLNVKPSMEVNLNALARDESIDDIVAFATLVLW
jgi:hypothetical protein